MTQILKLATGIALGLITGYLGIQAIATTEVRATMRADALPGPYRALTAVPAQPPGR